MMGTDKGGTAPEGVAAPALQVIVLGSGGGPIEHNTTAFLVRSLASGWHRGSIIAVDAGVHLGAIARILQSTQPKRLGTDVPLPHILTTGPFAGLEVHSACPNTNASHIAQSLIDTYLITHPHLDHISGFVVNTAGFPGTRPKRLAGLPSTISAFKAHIFNNIIWPNLSDENNGAGLVTYMRLVEGGSPALGEGEERGYLEISDGLAVKTWSVSHGHCMEKHSHRGSQSSQGGAAAPASRFGSADASSVASPRHLSWSHSLGPNSLSTLPMSRIGNLLNQPSGAAAAAQGVSGISSDPSARVCVYDSSAYFIRDVVTGKEILIFGDVEPDSVSLSPRNLRVWREAAPKVAAGTLSGVFLECSYDNGQPLDRLFGHLKPAFIIEELKVLAAEVEEVKRATMRESRKRKRSVAYPPAGTHERDCEADSGDIADAGLAVRRRIAEEPISPRSMKPLQVPGAVPCHNDFNLDNGSTSTAPGAQRMATPSSDVDHREASSHTNNNGHAAAAPAAESSGCAPLTGLRVVIIHVKDKLIDGFIPGERILSELQEEEAIENLGCEFIMSSPGQSLFF